MSEVINVLIVDDHALVRASLKRILEELPNIKVVGEAADGDEALSLVRELKPHVVLMDVRMPGIGGLGATRKIMRQHPDVKVLVISTYDDDQFPSRLIEAGAMGYITKGAKTAEMAQAIQAVYRGERYVGTKVASHLALKNTIGAEKAPFDTLSEREFQIMLMVVTGIPVQEISKKLFLSPKTINSYRYRIFEKLNIENDVELTRLAIKNGLFDK